jgi:hypothetical protein
MPFHPVLALRSAKAEPQKHLYGITEEAPEGENLQAQAPQAHEGESPQEAFALQVVTALRVSGPAPPLSAAVRLLACSIAPRRARGYNRRR